MTLNQYGDWIQRNGGEEQRDVHGRHRFAPGMSNITCGEASAADTAESVIARVGGVPAKEAAARHPSDYMITWAFPRLVAT